MPKKILHLAGCDKFIPPFIEFVKEQFNFDEHKFLLTNGMAEQELKKDINVKLLQRTIASRLKYYLHSIISMQLADKIILHGLFDNRIVKILFFMPWLRKKCYWVMWGGDLYVYQLGERNWKWQVNEIFRRPVIKNIGHLVTYIEGDVNLARQWYKAKGKYHECLMYSSNLYKDYQIPNKKRNTINIQVGNSADPSNNHIEVLEKLLAYKDEDIHIYIPLAYGNKAYAQKVIDKSKLLFGDKVTCFTQLMPFEKYLEFLGTIDIAIFNHKRQQAMGNTITLLGLGKTVYIRSDTTQWQFFEEKNISINDINNLDSLSAKSNKHSIDIIKDYFSEDNYRQQLGRLF